MNIGIISTWEVTTTGMFCLGEIDFEYTYNLF